MYVCVYEIYRVSLLKHTAPEGSVHRRSMPVVLQDPLLGLKGVKISMQSFFVLSTLICRTPWHHLNSPFIRINMSNSKLKLTAKERYKCETICSQAVLCYVFTSESKLCDAFCSFESEVRSNVYHVNKVLCFWLFIRAAWLWQTS